MDTVEPVAADATPYQIIIDPIWGYRRLDPLPASRELDRFYESHYRDLLDEGGRAPDLARLLAGGPDAEAEQAWQAATLHADVLAALRQDAPEGLPRRALDVGCGTGELLRTLTGGGWEAIGIEPGPEVAAAGRAAGSQVETATGAEYIARWRAREDLPFGGMVLLNVLEHVPDPATLLQELLTALVPGGRLVVRVPNDFNPLQEAAHRALGGRRWWVAVPDHVNYFDHASIGALLERLELEVVERSADFPMELFLLMGEDYRDEALVGRTVHERRRRAELAMEPATRRALGRAWAAAGVGRNAFVVARKPGMSAGSEPTRAEAVDRPNVLVTSAARKVLLVRAFSEALARCGSGRVIAADISPLAAALYAADVARLVPRSDDPTFLDVLLRICEEERVGLLVPTRDEELPLLARARERFAAAGTTALVSSAEAVDTCRDKARFVAAVREAGLEAPAIYDDAAAVRYPAFVKPRFGKGARGATRVDDAGELAEALATIDALGDEALIQAFVDAREYTVDVFFDLEGRPISCVPRERMAVVGGESVVGRTVRDPELSAASIRLCGAIGLIGHLTVQAFRTPDGVSFIEINPRYGGAANLGFEAGAFTPEYAVRAARGERLDPHLGDYEAGLFMLRHSADLFVRERDLIGGGGRR